VISTLNSLFVASRMRSGRGLQHQVDHLNSLLESAAAERQKSEQLRRGLVDQLDSMTSEHQRLQATNCELQRQRDVLDDERNDLQIDLERQQKENERWYMSAVYFSCVCVGDADAVITKNQRMLCSISFILLSPFSHQKLRMLLFRENKM